jgi:hypothetical protein
VRLDGERIVKRAVSISLGSPARDKKVEVCLNGQSIQVERVGTGGDVDAARRLFTELDGKVDALGVGGVDIYLRLGDREYPLRAALSLVKDVHRTPVLDGRGLKHTLEKRVFELAAPFLGETPHFRRAFVPVAVDRIGLAEAVEEVSDRVILGDLMIALGIPIPIYGLVNYRRIARLLFPVVSYFPMSLLFYGSKGDDPQPKYTRHFKDADLIAGDFLFLRKHVPDSLSGKTVITNTTTPDNIDMLRSRGVKTVITTTPRYEGRSFGTNLMEATLTAYSGKRRPLTDEELNSLIDELGLKPTVEVLNP